MPVTMRLDDRVTFLGFSFPSLVVQESGGGEVRSVSAPPAKTGTLTTRTNNTEGELTMAGGHGITTGARLDLYWAGGSRRGITVGTVATNAVPLTDSGTGDNLPAQSTAITAMVPVEEEFLFTGDLAIGLAFSSTQRGTIVLAESNNSESTARVLTANVSSIWSKVRDSVNPVATKDVAKVFFSHASSTQTATMRVGVQVT